MSFTVNFDGVDMGTVGSIPDGKYNLRIVSAEEKYSKKGDPMVVVDYEVMDGPYAGRSVRFHYVVFFNDKTSKGAGISKNYLKTIGLPYEGQNVNVDASKWVGRCLVGKVVSKTNDDGTCYPSVKFVDKLEVDYTLQKQNETKDDDVPF